MQLCLVFIFTVVYLTSIVSGQCYGSTTQLYTYDDTWQTLRYPDSGLNYGNDLYCEWLITTSASEQIVLDVISYNIEYRYDFLRIYDAQSPSSATSDAYELAELTDYGTNQVFESTYQYLRLVFTSDGSIGFTGFVLRFRQKVGSLLTTPVNNGTVIDECYYESETVSSNSCQNGGYCEIVNPFYRRCNCPMDTTGLRCEISLNCDLLLEADMTPKFIQSPYYPLHYGDWSDCYWILYSSDYIEVEVVDFDLDYGYGDQIFLYDGRYDNDDENFVAYLRNTDDEPEQVGRKFYSSGRYFRVQFTSDDSTGSAGNRGFRIRYQWRPEPGGDVNISIFIGAGVGALAFIAIVIGCCCCCRRKQNTTNGTSAIQITTVSRASNATDGDAPLPKYPLATYRAPTTPRSRTSQPPDDATVIPTTTAVTFNHGGSLYFNQPATNPSAHYTNTASYPSYSTAIYENAGYIPTSVSGYPNYATSEINDAYADVGSEDPPPPSFDDVTRNPNMYNITPNASSYNS